tara:strand:+ start:2485 stop:3366 length:882 start_codon:yes stop_codon:yes gene_type:complete
MKLYAPPVLNGAKLLGVFESGTSEWHEARADGIGGSEVGTIMGLNRWESAYYLWASKTGKLPQKEIDSFPAWLGTNLEPFILGPMLEKLHPDWDVSVTGTYQHPTISYLHANPDAIAIIDGEMVIVEVKTSRNYWDEVPASYIAQVQHYMKVLGIKRSVIIGLVAMDPVEHWIEYDEFESDVATAACERFWDSVVNDEAPDWDGSDSTYQAIRELNPDITDEEVEIDGVHNLPLLQQAAEDAESELRKAKSNVLSVMGKAKHAYVEYDGKKIRVASRQSRGTGKPFLVIRKGK